MLRGKGQPHLPAGWAAGGLSRAAYDIGTDQRVAHGGHASGYMFARDAKFDDWATLVQTVRADDFRGRRVRLSGYLRSEGVLGGAALWMRVDGLRARSGSTAWSIAWFAGPPTGSATK